jgi:hypothetical protein
MKFSFRIATAASLAVLVSAPTFAGCTTYAAPVPTAVYVAPPPRTVYVSPYAVYVAPPPRPAVWVPGHWVGSVWVPGHWA